ncbi:linker for activation of T-cells family member 1 isoform X2 [Neoarius graeffei]|uniref:linker for activation of T-cells family member 1 isoform X2 n=1 Tax=Neoarius graeffei TaxID=443677 RepID=UPI00298C5CD3|nr:linker for activation of T-cells family member 1 isoform X2 [Neoarius graeffei]
MDSTALLTVVCVAVVVLFIFLIGLCLNCNGNNQPTYIRQQHDPRNSYAPNFTVVRSYAEPPSFAIVPVQPLQHQLITSPSMPDARRISDRPSSDGGSQSDYINQNETHYAASYEQSPEKTPDYPDYLDVLPNDQNDQNDQHKLGSSLNSGQSYQNIEKDDNDDDSDSQHYINVNEDGKHSLGTPVGSFDGFSSDDNGSSEYVNAPNLHK